MGVGVVGVGIWNGCTKVINNGRWKRSEICLCFCKIKFRNFAQIIQSLVLQRAEGAHRVYLRWWTRGHFKKVQRVQRRSCISIFIQDLSSSKFLVWTFPRLQFCPCTDGQEAEKQKVIWKWTFCMLPTLYQDYFHWLWNSNIWKICNRYGWTSLELGFLKDRLTALLVTYHLNKTQFFSGTLSKGLYKFTLRMKSDPWNCKIRLVNLKNTRTKSRRNIFFLAHMTALQLISIFGLP